MTRQRPLSDALSCVLRWAAGQTDTAKERPTRHRASRTLIILIDGTLSTDLARGARNTCWLAIQAVGAKHDDHQRASYLGAVVGKFAHQLARVGAARPLSNIPLIWMMKHSERHGPRLPEAWRVGLHINAKAPSVGMSLGLGRFIWVRAKRKVKLSSFEWIHPSVSDRN